MVYLDNFKYKGIGNLKVSSGIRYISLLLLLAKTLTINI